MAVQRTSPEIYSVFGGDSEMSVLVDLFVDEMPDRIASINAALTSGDMETLQRTAHQMKGACGSYGFDQLTSYAADVERAVREGESDESVRSAVEELVQICGQVRAGEPG